MKVVAQLPVTVFDSLLKVAQDECRTPGQQAAWIIQQALKGESAPQPSTSQHRQDRQEVTCAAER